MKILITAGGTTEKIDEVRHITNQATGRLGKEIAQAFSDATCHITYVHGPNAVLPSGENITFHPIDSVQSLLDTLKNQLKTQPYDAVIHSMAVSDYQLLSVKDEVTLGEDLFNLINKKPEVLKNKDAFQKTLIESLKPEKSLAVEKKISSKNEHLIVSMDTAPKVIKVIKEIQPDTILVGFKLLVGVTEEKLINVARTLMEKNDADFVLANDLENIEGQNHLGLLIGKTGQLEYFENKKAIADGIKTAILKNMKGL